MGPEKHRLSKGMSTPRRCSYCQKIMFFKTYRCKHCRYRCHKKCANHTHRKSSSCHRTYSGEEHWTKVLQANEVNSNLVVYPCNGKHPSVHHHCYDGSTRHGQTRCAKASSQAKEDSTPTEPRDSNNIFSTLYARFIQWVASTRSDSTSSSTAGRRTPRQSRSRSSSIQSSRSQGQDILQLLQAAQMSDDIHHTKCFHASISSEESEFSSFHRTSYSSTCSSLTATSTSTANSDCPTAWNDSLLTTGTLSNGYLSSLTNSANKNCYENYHKRRLRSNMTFTISCPLKTKRPSISLPDSEARTAVLCATWPPSGRKIFNHDDDDDVGVDLDDDDDLDGSVFEYEEGDAPNKENVLLRESLGEFSIPYNDLQFEQCVRIGRQSEIYRGRWHGEVMVHTYHNLSDAEVTQFWEQVSKLSMIRHENVALFMGACIDPPNLAVVTSVRKGVSLYEQVHLHSSEKMSMQCRMVIVKQISQAMGYLHAKGIVMTNLHSKNIYLEPKVKLCLMDYGMSEKKYDRPMHGSVSRGYLTYVAPEIISTLRVESPSLVSDTPSSTSTDVFAFGTILYELMTGHFPFRGASPEIIIWQVAKGRRQPLRQIKCGNTLKNLISQCWSHLPHDRPEFSDINRDLEQNTALHKRHSSSEPERMHRMDMVVHNVFT